MTYGNYDKEPTRRTMFENQLNSLLNAGKAQKAQDVQEVPKKPLFEKTFDDFNTDTKTNDEYIDRTEFREGVMPELDEKLDTEMAGDVKQKAMALFDRYSGADKKLNIDEFNKMKKDLDKIVELAYDEKKLDDALNRVFKAFDNNPKDHYLNKKEAFQYLQELEATLPFDNFTKVREKFSKDFDKAAGSDGQINVNEFRALMKTYNELKPAITGSVPGCGECGPSGYPDDTSIDEPKDAPTTKPPVEDTPLTTKPEESKEDEIIRSAYEENIKNLGSAVADALIGYTTEDDANAVRRSLDSLKPDELMAFLKGYIENGGDGRSAFFQQLQSEYYFDRLDDTLRLGAYIMSEFARKHGLNDIVSRIKVELLNPEIDVKNAKELDKIAFELLERFEPQWWEGNK